jgi:putative membrane protein
VTTNEPRSANQLAEERTGLAATRTLMAADRTLMAWVRTSLSLLGFGFTIYKILQEFQKAGFDLPQEHTPRNVGLFLTGLGTVAMLMGTIEYWGVLKELGRANTFSRARPALYMAVVMSVTGLVLFFSIITRIF